MRTRKIHRGGDPTAATHALYNAVMKNDIRQVETLLEGGADFNTGHTVGGITPLFLASEKGNLEIAKKLIEKGADVNKSTTNNGFTPLYIATVYNRLQIVEELLKHGAEVNKTNNYGLTPLFSATQHGHLKLVQKLLEYGADINKGKTIEGITPLHIAAEVGHYHIVKMLLEEGADVNIARTSTGVTPLYAASEKGFFDIVEKLLENGADANKARSDNGVTPLYVASEKGYLSIVENLLEKGADANKGWINNGVTPLLIASEKGYLSIAKKLLEYGANINNGRAAHGITPLYRAAQNGQLNIVKFLLEKGADKTLADKEGKLPIDVAKTGAIRELLEEKVFKILWTGFSKADIDFTNNVFHQVTHPNNLTKLFPDESLYSICPVCLKHIQHENQTCMYMTHSCVEQAGYEGYYHKLLWNTFSYEKQYDNMGRNIPPEKRKRILEWCTHCGRICKDHKHYKLAPLFKSDGSINVPEFAGSGLYYATTCDNPAIGGGGLPEKINRYRRFREVVLTLNDADFIGKLTYEEAINMVVEALWEAPLDPRRLEMSIIKTKKAFNVAVANTRFPLPSELPPPPKYVYSNPAYPNAATAGLKPLVTPTATNTIKNSAYDLFMEDENIVQFRHRMANGVTNEHAGPNQQIALNRLIRYIQHISETPSSADFGMCWQFSKENYMTLLDDATHMPPQCTARLYPEELLMAIENATYASDELKATHMNVYRHYQKLFSQKFGKPIGLAKNLPAL